MQSTQDRDAPSICEHGLVDGTEQRVARCDFERSCKVKAEFRPRVPTRARSTSSTAGWIASAPFRHRGVQPREGRRAGRGLLTARRRLDERAHDGDVLGVLVESPPVARTVLGADEGIGPSAAFGHMIDVEAMAIDRLVEVGAQLLAQWKADRLRVGVPAECRELPAVLTSAGDVRVDEPVARLRGRLGASGQQEIRRVAPQRRERGRVREASLFLPEPAKGSRKHPIRSDGGWSFGDCARGHLGFVRQPPPPGQGEEIADGPVARRRPARGIPCLPLLSRERGEHGGKG